MNPASLEVFCPNLDCGDSYIAGALLPRESRRHRRMNYMGRKRIGFGFAVVESLVRKQVDPNLPALPPGVYHLFQCPVCGRERVFSNGANC